MPAEDRREVAGLLQRCIGGLLVSVLFSAVFLAKAGTGVIVGAGALLLSGIFLAALLVFSWRHYHPYWSWLIWAVPGPALIMSAVQLFVFPLVSTGAISVLLAVTGVSGCVGAGFFGALFALRGHVWRWLNPDGT